MAKSLEAGVDERATYMQDLTFATSLLSGGKVTPELQPGLADTITRLRQWAAKLENVLDKAEVLIEEQAELLALQAGGRGRLDEPSLAETEYRLAEAQLRKIDD